MPFTLSATAPSPLSPLVELKPLQGSVPRDGGTAARGGTMPEPSEHQRHVTKTKLGRTEAAGRQVLALGVAARHSTGHRTEGPHLRNPLSGWMSVNLRDMAGQRKGNSPGRCPCPHQVSKEPQGVISSPSAGGSRDRHSPRSRRSSTACPGQLP